ncbi:hypothetical protein GT755_02215 [Herbidospora sp. NEAU-GS84]|uniref:Uncharacterized protein n=1 Tax=Herbidospora solisilvae TaxID=2696284 RepID=A0A7C9NBP1_9ACTN|nr:hypothetical protein [Herbidospora solisilvae]
MRFTGGVGEQIVIGARFNGPPASANGGYAAGLAAAFVDGPARVSLRRPPPLETPLDVVRDGAGVRVLHDGVLVAEAGPSDAEFPDPPVRPDLAAAAEARERHPWIGVRNMLTGCFVCGHGRADGLRVTPGRLPDADVCAAPFEPDATVTENGVVRPEILWAALDCVGYPPFAQGTEVIALLGTLEAEIVREVAAGERLVAVGWPLGSSGRKSFSASALLSADEVVARARATWITVPDAVG